MKNLLKKHEYKSSDQRAVFSNQLNLPKTILHYIQVLYEILFGITKLSLAILYGIPIHDPNGFSLNPKQQCYVNYRIPCVLSYD